MYYRSHQQISVGSNNPKSINYIFFFSFELPIMKASVSWPSLDWLQCRLAKQICPVFSFTMNLEISFNATLCWNLCFRDPRSSSFSVSFCILVEYLVQVLSEKGRLGNSFLTYMSINVIILRLYFINSLAGYVILVTNVPSQCKHCSSAFWHGRLMPLWLSLCMACYLSLELILSLPLGVLKFHNHGPWHGLIQSFYCMYSEPIKSGNMPISSGKFLKWFLWKFLHALSLSETPTIWLLDLQTNLLTFYPVLLFSISLPFCFTFLKIFF